VEPPTNSAAATAVPMVVPTVVEPTAPDATGEQIEQSPTGSGDEAEIIHIRSQSPDRTRYYGYGNRVRGEDDSDEESEECDGDGDVAHMQPGDAGECYPDDVMRDDTAGPAPSPSVLRDQSVSSFFPIESGYAASNVSKGLLRRQPESLAQVAALREFIQEGINDDEQRQMSGKNTSAVGDMMNDQTIVYPLSADPRE
jgi:hypothetical protein